MICLATGPHAIVAELTDVPSWRGATAYHAVQFLDKPKTAGDPAGWGLWGGGQTRPTGRRSAPTGASPAECQRPPGAQVLPAAQLPASWRGNLAALPDDHMW